MPQMPAVAYRIKPGDTLSGIARATLGGAREWPRILAFNNMDDVLARGGARIADPDRIRAGDTIYLPLLGPASPAALRPPASPGPQQALGLLKPLMSSTPVRVSTAYDIQRHILTVEHPAYTARVTVTCRFSLALADKVMVAHVIGKGFELTTQAETKTAFGTLVSDTTIAFDPRTRSIGVTNGMTTQGSLVQLPKTAIAVEMPRPGQMPVLRAEISYPKLTGRVGRHHYVATGVTYAVEIEPRMPPLRGAPLSAPSRMIAPIPAFDWSTIDTRALAKTALIAGVVVLAAAFAAWVFVPLAAGLGTAQFASLVGAVLLGSATMAN